jgi:hypothetical protein
MAVCADGGRLERDAWLDRRMLASVPGQRKEDAVEEQSKLPVAKDSRRGHFRVPFGGVRKT